MNSEWTNTDEHGHSRTDPAVLPRSLGSFSSLQGYSGPTDHARISRECTSAWG